MATGGEMRTTPMADVQSRSPAPPRPLSLQVDSPPSASPFPSPSSSFLPPPMPGAHEFAVKPPPRRRSAVSTTLSGDDSAAAASNAVRDLLSESTVSHHQIDALSPTTTPMQQPSRLSRISTTLEEPSKPAVESEPASASRRQSNSISSPTILNSPSLASSRPAPLSPAPSRRVSTISTRSSKSGTLSTPMSRSNSRKDKRGSAGFPKRLSALSTATATRKGDHDDTVINDEPLITPTVSDSSMNLQSTPTTSLSSSASPSTTIIPISSPSSSTPTTTTTSPQNLNPASSSSITSPHPHPPNTYATHHRPTSTKIKIRDFAYPSTDNRYHGMGSDVPKPNQFSRLNKKLGGPKKAGSTLESGRGRAVKTKKRKSNNNNNGWDESDDDDDENDDDDDGDDDTSDDEEELEEDEEEGWFKKGMGRFSWSFAFPGFKKQVQDSVTSTSRHASYPSRGEMDLNFSTATEDETPSSESSEYYDAPEDEASNQGEVDEEQPEEDGILEDEEEEPLYPGLYRALYPFEPEGTAEMRLVEDQIVRVVGRGGGVGWAVVVVPDGVDGGVVVVTPMEGDEEKETIRHALVPESYLELVRVE